MAMVSNNLGEVLSDQGEFNEAIKAFRRCLETWSGIGYSIGVVISQNNMGRAYTRQGQWQIAVDHLSQSINLIEKMETRGILAAEAYQRLAEAHLCAGHPRLALQLCEQSLSFAEQGQLAVVEGVTRRVMGQAYRCLEEWDDAEKSLILSGSILKERGVPHELASTRWESALLYSGMARAGVKHDLAGIAAVVDEAVSIFKELGIKYDMAKAAALRALADGAPTSLPPPLSP
jgi:tetratricopeptide (TPR) repeat protein